jgi:hypothetical protein
MVPARIYLFVAAGAVICAGLGAAAYEFYALTKHSADLAQELQAVHELSRRRADIRYGTVVAIDTQRGTLTLRRGNPYQAGGEPRDSVVRVADSTFIARQELIRAEDGTITGVEETAPASLSDMSVGDKAAYLSFSQDGALILHSIFFGDPL